MHFMEKTIEELIDEETKIRLMEMEKPDYVFPPKADGRDAVGIVAGIMISIMLIVLCMLEVIL